MKAIRFSSALALICLASSTIFNPVFGQTCNLPSPNNFLAKTEGSTIKLTWQPMSATAGFRIEVFDLTTGLFFFNGNAGASATSFTVSGIDPKHRYLASARAKCPSNCVSGGILSGNPTSAIVGRVIVEDIVFFTGGCNNPCPNNYGSQLAGNGSGTLLWTEEGAKNKRSIFHLDINKVGQNGGSSKLKIARDAGLTSTIRYAECNVDNNCECTPTDGGKDTIRCRTNGTEICKIWFSQPNNIHFLRSNNWKVNFEKETCTLPFGIDGDGIASGGEPEFLLASPENDGPAVAPAEVLVVPNPASDDVEFQFQLVENEAVTLEIFTPMGQLIEQISENETREKGSNSLRFDASKLPSGSYFVSLRGATWQSAARFEKM